MFSHWAEQRRRMVERQLRGRGIRDERVLQAMARIPREEFIPAAERASAYEDRPIPIGFGQTISQPYMTALMAQELELSGGEDVLEIGAGSGYAAAVLSQLAARVIAVEIVPGLAESAGENLSRLGCCENAVVITGDASLGYSELAPYDAISVAAGAPELPPQLLDQLKDPGRLVIPVGPLSDQELLVVAKRDGAIVSRTAALCRFVPLRGGGGWG